MAVTEEQRHDLHSYFQETMGRERAVVMMELLPPVGWGEVATKQDLAMGLENLRLAVHAEIADVRTEIASVRTEIASVRTEIADVRAEFHSVMRATIFGYVGSNVALLGLGLAGAKLFF